ncbi:NAD(P)/FAD-dependent oxidoreductase [Terricaulis sp.]|uniref:NAD(P)/FAD-dependent oxidoreductase n=1 Tax=Terricaulis sp. TaxID=2768686 RepID=UPI003783D1C2
MEESRNVWDAAIIGGGIVGMSAALELRARGRSVIVLDRDLPRERASYGNAGVIARTSILPLATPAVWRNIARYAVNADIALRLRHAALPGLSNWLTRFLANCNIAAVRRAAKALNPLVAAALDQHVHHADMVGAQAQIKRNGFLKLYRTEAAFAASGLERSVLREAGVKVELVQRGALVDLEPALERQYAWGLFSPDSASVERPDRLLEAYRRGFCSRGGSFRACRAGRLRQREHGVDVLTDGGVVAASYAVIAAGAWSNDLTAPLGYKISMASERGYHARLAARAQIQRPIIDTGGAYSIVPEGDAVRVMTGVELAGSSDAPNYTQLHHAIDQARAAFPLGEMTADPLWMAPRPSAPDGLPVIGRAPKHPRIVFAFGHGHIGFSTGPITGRVVADLIDDAEPPIPLAPFSAARFA